MLKGNNAALYAKIEVHSFFSNLMLIRTVTCKDSIVVAKEKNSKAKPAISFRASELRKSHISHGDVRIERNITTEANEVVTEETSMTVNAMNVRW